MKAELFGSLGATGRGHGSVGAVVRGWPARRPRRSTRAARRSTTCGPPGGCACSTGTRSASGRGRRAAPAAVVALPPRRDALHRARCDRLGAAQRRVRPART
ncbi:hypothetical protein [Pseudonocardia yuanmonensis]|uniref:hypothetical protein n=1 Tax=Pseudonocardia yuanmonensis TaxID=1095914 RepID=UPI003CD052BC